MGARPGAQRVGACCCCRLAAGAGRPRTNGGEEATAAMTMESGSAEKLIHCYRLIDHILSS